MSIFDKLFVWMWTRLHREEQGQDTAEYIVMTAVVVAIITGVIYLAYSGALQTAVDNLATQITSFAP